MRSLQLAVFYHISRALFKADRLMFALSFVHGTMPKMFQPKVLLIQAVRPDRLYSAMQNFVLKTLSIPSVNPPPFDLSDILRESSNQEPVLLILAGGADPSQELEKLAANTIGLHNYTSISMGQGQEQATIDAIRRASADGQWLCLQNVHLMLSIIPVIQKELSAVTPHEKFRLWMTTEEENKFPAIMLQRSLKVTFEPPPEADWEFIRGLLMYVVYGGRIENIFDSQVLESYLLTLFTPEKVTGRSGQMLAERRRATRCGQYQGNTAVYHDVNTFRRPAKPLWSLPMNIRFSWQLTEAEDTIARMRIAGIACP
ncbi:dynein heavy chain [Ostertagia ostertagi]